MILYFADRRMNILGQASTHLPHGLTVKDDLKTEDVESGVASFECRIPYDKTSRADVERFAAVGNYILRSNGDENEFYTIIDSEANTRDKEVYVYAEDAGLDLLNEIVGDFEATEAHPIAWYVERFTADSGFEIGLNEISNLTRKLKWEGEETVTSRLASLAAQFDGSEISYSYKVEGLAVTRKIINIHKERGKDTGVQLRLDKEVDRIVSKKSIANLATALKCTGGTPEDENTEDDIDPVPITLNGYKYDDGDFYTDGEFLKSRKAVQTWSRYVWNKEPNKLSNGEGHIVRLYEYDTLSQSELCAHAITELKKAREVEINYEIDIKELPKGVKIGDRVNVIDDAMGLYFSARILMLQTSVVDETQTATIGEYIMKDAGIAEKVEQLASKFAELSVSASRAKQIATDAKKAVETANTQAQRALQNAQAAQGVAEEAKAAADAAQASVEDAQTKANEAKEAVDGIVADVEGMEQSVADAEAAAELARQAAQTAETKAEEAHTAAINAGTQAQTAEQKATEAKQIAESVEEKADTAKSTAETAKAQAEDASTTANAAKLDAQKAQEEIDGLGDNLTTLERTMKAEYARKTDLTEAEAELQTQITQNAAGIKSNASRVQVIDETANDAAIKAQASYYSAEEAQRQAEEAQQKADEATQVATDAWTAYESAQAEADTAKAAADTAQRVLEEAEAELIAAEENLAELEKWGDATAEEIEAAQYRVEDALAAVERAYGVVTDAQAEAEAAQATASEALQTAEEAQTAADSASAQATIAQKAVEAVEGSATAQAQKIADEAKEAAQQAQATADEATQTATSAQTKADEAKAQADTAKANADAAEATAQQAQADLEAAQQRLEEVSAKADATETDVAQAKADVEAAQSAADQAKADAQTAQSAADQAKADAESAQNAADAAQADATEAQTKATEAKEAADQAKADVEALEIRVTNSETQIQQTSERIELLATKEEVTQRVNDIQVGGRNFIRNSAFLDGFAYWSKNDPVSLDTIRTRSGHPTAFVNSIGNTSHVFCSVLTKQNWDSNTMPMKDVKAGEILTASVWYYMDDVSTVDESLVLQIEGLRNDGTMYTFAYLGLQSSQLVEGEWTRLVLTGKCQEDYVAVGINSYVIQNGVVWFTDYKLERGNKATDWTPAIEDTEIQVGGRNYVRHGKGDAKKGFFENFAEVEDGYVAHTLTSQYDWPNIQQVGAYTKACKEYEVGATMVWSYDIMYTQWDVPDVSKIGELWMGQRYSCPDDGSWTEFNWLPVTAVNLPKVGENGIELNKWYHIEQKIIIPQGADIGTQEQLSFHYRDTEISATIGLCLKNVKLEYGTTATDWTAAPEDMEATIDDVNASILQQTTQIIQECDKMLFTALESYVENGDYNAFKESVEAQLAVLSDSITMTFTQTQEAISNVDADLQDKFNTITTYFTFDIDGLIIGKVDNPYRMVLSNERYSMTVNGEEVMYIDAVTKAAFFPKLTVTDVFNLLGYQIEKDADGLVNWDWIGGE